MLKYLAALAAASALVVRDGNELRTALANGASEIELAADAYLGGEAAIVSGTSFVGVSAAMSGGAIYAVDAPVVIDACNFTDVEASGDGGAVVAGALTIHWKRRRRRRRKSSSATSLRP